jgi:dienelactone hydrolase
VHRLLLASIFAALMVLPGGASGATAPRPTFAALARQFDYDSSAPLDLQQGAPVPVGDATVTAVSFSIDGVNRMTGDLAVPSSGSGPFAAVVLAPVRGGSHGSFEQEAVALAGRGAVALALDDLAGSGFPSFTGTDIGFVVRRVIGLRRAVDMLLARDDVDPARLGFAGMSDGGELGGILVGVDHRLAAAILGCAGGIWDAGGNRWYLRRMHQLDPVLYIGHAAPTEILFQAGTLDREIPPAEARSFARAASKPNRIRWYVAPHRLNAQAYADEVAWLAVKLGLSPR